MNSMRPPEIDDDINYYVVFDAAKYDHWIYRFIDRSMGHVYAVKDLNDFQWLVIQPRVNMTDVKIMLKCQYPVIQMIAGPDAKVVKVKVKYPMKARGAVNFFTCVEQVKALLGIKSFFTLTPKQLYNGLIGGRYG